MLVLYLPSTPCASLDARGSFDLPSRRQSPAARRQRPGATARALTDERDSLDGPSSYRPRWPGAGQLVRDGDPCAFLAARDQPPLRWDDAAQAHLRVYEGGRLPAEDGRRRRCRTSSRPSSLVGSRSKAGTP